MIVGVGVDTVDVPGFARQLADPASVFAERVFTALEHDVVAGRPARDKAAHFAARYAAKEAFIKAWSASRSGAPAALATVDLADIEVRSDARGRPSIALHGAVAVAFAAAGARCAIHLSMSHDGDVAVAFVVIDDVAPRDGLATKE
mgnify:CR=1 FL=1